MVSFVEVQNHKSSPTIYKVLKEHLGYVSNRLVKAECERSEQEETYHAK